MSEVSAITEVLTGQGPIVNSCEDDCYVTTLREDTSVLNGGFTNIRWNVSYV